MVKLHTSLLAVTLVTVSALACSGSDEFQRRGEFEAAAKSLHVRFGLACRTHDNLQSRGFVDEEDLFVRDDAFDDLEAREPGGGGQAASDIAKGLWHLGKRIHRHPRTRHIMKGVEYASDAINVGQTLDPRDVEDNEDLFVRDIDAFDDLEAREPGGGGQAASDVVKGLWNLGKRIHRHPRTRQIMKGAEYASDAINVGQTLDPRDVEDNEDLFVRDIDTFNDLEARGPGGGTAGALSTAMRFGKEVANHPHTRHAMRAAGIAMDVANTASMVQSIFRRDLEDNENIFERDLDAEELFYGREYDFFEERDTVDDLD